MVKEMRDLSILLELARSGAHMAPRAFTTVALARRLSISQATVARRLAELQRDGLISRSLEPRGQRIQLTPAGLAVLRSLHQELSSILNGKPRVLELIGRVVSGFGEGSYYMSQQEYRQQFRRELGFDPYPGTLDIKLDARSLELRSILLELPGKHIEGFKASERTFGPVKCFPATLRGVKAAVVLPARSHHTDVIEVIAPKNLRKSLKLEDGDVVKIEVSV